ncbi:MAG TPA: hypothetical protein VE035_12120 [Puia sp.]|nr:hypothetical protein [Puia sp.]
MAYPSNPGGTILNIVLNAKAHEKIKADFANSTCISMSEYARKMIFGEPVTMYYRNKSFDEFAQEAIRLRKELQEVRSKLPFTPESERRVITLIEEIKTIINKIADTNVRRRKI